MHRQELIPPEKPFVCQNVTTTRFTQVIHCCSSHSFCNIENVRQVTLPIIFVLIIDSLTFARVFFVAVFYTSFICLRLVRTRGALNWFLPRETKNYYYN